MVLEFRARPSCDDTFAARLDVTSAYSSIASSPARPTCDLSITRLLGGAAGGSRRRTCRVLNHLLPIPSAARRGSPALPQR